MSLSFDVLRKANKERRKHDKYILCQTEWSTAHWLQALVGEVGELANLLKKVDRGDFNGATSLDREGVHMAIGMELADIQTYLDILADELNVDLGIATIAKFNEVSERIGSDIAISGDGLCAMRVTADGCEDI